MLIMALAPNINHAYFQSKLSESNFLMDGYKVNLSENENTLVVYDNFMQGSIEENQVFFSKSKFFVPADLTSIASPLPITFYSYRTTENALGDLLYANLKMKKLIEEYKDNQARSKKLIWDSSQLFQQKNHINSIYQISQRVRNDSVQTSIQRNGTLIVSTGRLSSDRAHYSRSAFNRSKRLRPNFTSPVNRYTTNNNRTARFHNVEDQDEGKFNKEDTKTFFFNNNETERGDDIEEENRDERKLYEEKNKITQQKFNRNSQREHSDPIIIKLINKLFNLIPYFIAHKGEAVFYGIGLYFALWFFSTILKR